MEVRDLSGRLVTKLRRDFTPQTLDSIPAIPRILPIYYRLAGDAQQSRNITKRDSRYVAAVRAYLHSFNLILVE